MIVIADSGSTKIDWLMFDETTGQSTMLQTSGINPFYLAVNEIEKIVADNMALYAAKVTKVYFYGAGCVPGKCSMVEMALCSVFRHAKVKVYSDLLGAARGLHGRQPGVACILGTGSNSCYYDGKKIVSNVSSLGYILGDEGSGARMGIALVSDFLKHQMPLEVEKEFQKCYPMTTSDVLGRVYSQPFPNRFLAQFAMFIKGREDNEYIHHLATEHIRSFVSRNVMRYEQSKTLSVSFTGSIALGLESIVREVSEEFGITIGRITKSPLEGLLDYHCKK